MISIAAAPTEVIAVAPIPSLAWKRPYAVAKKERSKKKEKGLVISLHVPFLLVKNLVTVLNSRSFRPS